MLFVPARIDHRWCPLAVAAAAMLIPLRVARAEDSPAELPSAPASHTGAEVGADAAGAIASVEQINRKALEDYDSLNFDEARSGLKTALALCDHSGLGSHPVRARTYLNMGVVLLAADAKHREVAVAHFRRAIQIEADIQPAKRVANPEVQQAFAEARASVEADRTSTRAPAPGATRAPPGGAAARESDLRREEDQAPTAAHPARWLLGFGVGSGFGWANGAGEVNSRLTVPPGFHPSSVVHLAPEIGYFVRPDLLLSLQGRIQLISGTTPERDPNGRSCGADRVCSPSHGASALFAKATWLMRPSGFRPFLSAALGFGQIRQVVSLPDHNDCGADVAHPVTCVDTTVAGPVFLGPGGGFVVELGAHVALTLGLSTLVAISAFTVQVDASGGVVIEL
jgi:hypothetical protein